MIIWVTNLWTFVLCACFKLCCCVSIYSAAFQPFLESSFQQVYDMRDVSYSISCYQMYIKEHAVIGIITLNCSSPSLPFS